jgi:hypothetical protein
MAKMTLLEIVQDILSAMDSDEVNSIGDTVESLQVAQEVRTTYYDLYSSVKTPSHQKILTLQPLSDPTRPNYLKIPDNVSSVTQLMYKNDDNSYSELRYLEPEDFIRLTQFNQSAHPFIAVTDLEYNSVSFNAITNQSPRHWTTFDNKHLVFDSFNSRLDSTLQESRVVALGYSTPDFHLADDFVPDMDSDRFPLLLSSAKAACFVNFKGISNANEERRARRQQVRAQNDLWRADQRRPYNKTPDYGRRRR